MLRKASQGISFFALARLCWRRTRFFTAFRMTCWEHSRILQFVIPSLSRDLVLRPGTALLAENEILHYVQNDMLGRLTTGENKNGAPYVARRHFASSMNGRKLPITPARAQPRLCPRPRRALHGYPAPIPLPGSPGGVDNLQRQRAGRNDVPIGETDTCQPQESRGSYG